MKRQQNPFKKSVIFFALFLVIIAGISVLWHYPVTIVDALTSEDVPGFGIHIPAIRIVFEPFLGLPFYFNRSLYPLSEVPLALVWVFIVFLMIRLGRHVTNRGKRIRTLLADLLLKAGLLFIIFVLLIFIRWPGNTITNPQKNMILVTTHCHTDYSHDGLIGQKQLWKWHRRNGFDAFFITDHNNHDKTLDFVNAQRNGDFEIHPLVMCGEEFSGTNHLSLLGLKTKFSTKGFADTSAVNITRTAGGAVMVNHWFDGEHKSLEYYRDLGVDGFEIENTATDRFYDRKIYQKIKSFCRENHLIMNGGLDFHGYGNLCSIWNAFRIPGWHRMSPEMQEQSILKILRSRDQKNLKVLLYHDRPYYNKKNLFLRQWVSLINYFRTLNLLQILSWIIWAVIFILIRKQCTADNRNGKSFSRLILPVMVVAGSLFLTVAAFFFHQKAVMLNGYNNVYAEYSRLFFYFGIPLLGYASIILGLRIKGNNHE